MVQTSEQPVPTCYQVLHVHPAAPQDLITAAYWKLTGLLRASRETDKAAEAGLYFLTRAYQILADHQSRETYDQSLGLASRPSPRVPLRRRSSWLPFTGRAREVDGDIRIDYYEIMRLDPIAHADVVCEAYPVMRNNYLRLVEQGQARPELIYLLEEAYAVLSDPAKRHEYDAGRGKSRPLHGTNHGSESNPDTLKGEISVADPDTEVKKEPFRDDQAGEVKAARAPVNGTSGPQAEQAMVNAEAIAIKAGEDDQEASEPTGPQSGRPVSRTSQDSEASAPMADDVVSGSPPTSKAIKALAATSAKMIMKSGQTSGHLARSATKALRTVIEGSRSSGNGAGATDEEEEAVLGRLFVTVADSPQQIDPADVRVLARLIVAEGEATGVSYDVRKVPLTVGGDDVCDITLAGLAPRQARLLYHGGQFVLHALTDDPPALLHGNRVRWTLLRDGDAIELGPYRVSLNITQ